MNLLLISLPWLVPMAWLSLEVFRRRQSRTRLQRVRLALGWPCVWALAAIPCQIGWLLVADHSYSDYLDVLWAFVLVPWPVHLGGWTVCQVFEATVESVTGHRQMTWLGNVHYWLALTAAQTLPLAAVVFARTRRRLARDPLALAVGLAVAVNASVNVAWPWWGS